MIIGRRAHLAGLALLSALLLLGSAASRVSAQSPQPETAQQQLAARHAPIVMLKQQARECDADGEPYTPAPVEIAFADPRVALKARTETRATDPTIATAPTAADLAAAGEDSYLDLPGNPRAAGCDFERHAKERMAGLTPTTYARIAIDGARGLLALQYWFYYYFNDFNNTHESDWEMIQLVWRTTSLDEALRRDPDAIGFAQHGGGELARWADAKLRREGARPIVYPAAGSHASYFGSGVYLGWGAGGTGFGCDDTTGPSVRVPLQPVLMPDPPTSTGPLAWLTYRGRWGERQSWEFNGPKGPNLGTKWDDPIRAISDWRPSSLEVPAAGALGPTATDVFCRVAEGGSQLLIAFGVRPWTAALTGVAALVLPIALLVWARGDLGAALGVYRSHWRTFGSIGLLAIPIGWALNGAAVLLSDNPPLDWLIRWFGGKAGAYLFAAALVGIVQQATMLVLVGPAVIQAVADIRTGRVPGVLDCYREALRNLGALLRAMLIVAGVVGGLGVTLVGTPVAIWLGVRWQFFGQATLVDGAPGAWAALRGSAAAVRGRWLRAWAAALAFQLIGALPGPVIGVILLIFGGSSPRLANGVSSFIYAVTIPVSLIGLTLVYLRLTGRATTLPAPAPPVEPAGDAGRRLLPWGDSPAAPSWSAGWQDGRTRVIGDSR